jgi:hypothetical protein
LFNVALKPFIAPPPQIKSNHRSGQGDNLAREFTAQQIANTLENASEEPREELLAQMQRQALEAQHLAAEIGLPEDVTTYSGDLYHRVQEKLKK